MPSTPDRTPGESSEEGIVFEDRPLGEEPTVPGQVRFVDGSFIFRDNSGPYDPRSGSGLSASQHKSLRDLTHLAAGGPFDGFASGAYLEILPAADPFPTSSTWWTSAAKTAKIVDCSVTRNANKTLATRVWRAYDVDGVTVLVTLTETFAYSGVFLLSVTRTYA